MVHVKDVSNPDVQLQEDSVMDTLRSLGLPQSMFDSMLTVNNKVDLLQHTDGSPQLTQTINALNVSCKSKYNLRSVADAIEDRLLAAKELKLVSFGVSPGGSEHDWLKSNCSVIEEVDASPNEHRALLKVSVFVSEVEMARMNKYCPQLLLKMMT